MYCRELNYICYHFLGEDGGQNSLKYSGKFNFGLYWSNITLTIVLCRDNSIFKVILKGVYHSNSGT
jgi:hypothetical protein